MSEGEVFIAVTVPVRASEIGIPQIVTEVGYQRGLQMTGCSTLTLSTALDPDYADRLFAMADGLLLTGGEDLDPSNYGEEPAGSRDVSPERDALEMDLAGRALEREIPILAICRGMQLLNVLRGGSLYQDLGSQRDGSLTHDRFEMFDREIHPVRFDEGSRWLRGLVPDEGVMTNSAHHQGLRSLGEGIRPVGRAEDGLVEAVEIDAEEGDAWTVGVQWHPERMLGDGSAGFDAALFRRFGEEVIRTARSRARPEVSWESLAER